MKTRIITYLKHVIGTFISLLVIGLLVLLSLNGSIGGSLDSKAKELHNEGPYVFLENDSTALINYLKGNKTDGFRCSTQRVALKDRQALSCYFALEPSTFNFTLENLPAVPPASYTDQERILAISDIESGFQTFRDFLIAHGVINKQLQWTFGKGHLVLVGDFMDRGNSATQVLWFIYKLEQEAQKLGGQVHFILGNHELKNLAGNYLAASKKYLGVATILEINPGLLWGKNSFLGQWIATKNSIERINGTLFTHGGMHPDITTYNLELSTINNIARENYFQGYYPRTTQGASDFINSTKTGISWYRGYFKSDFQPEKLGPMLQKYQAKQIVVGHTIQRRVQKLYDGQVYAIDVKHPKDYQSNWPSKSSEGLLIKDGKFFRAFSDGTLEAL
ncbi:conserved hypothetical protein [Tenacibaculum litopenaei]|uniref:metallophosphoesterase n=1 Tax=Tenacibaculum litopenaei TaxID=396016 RepID=UPI0038951E42